MTLPVACDLSSLTAEQQRREQALLAAFQAAGYAAAPTEGGYRFEVPAEPAILADLGELLALERLCCPFLRFELTVASGLGPVHLDVSGDGPAAAAFIHETFGRSR